MKPITAGALALALSAPLPGVAQDVRWLVLEWEDQIMAHLERMAEAFEAENPGVDVQIQALGPEPFKSRLTTMLQSDERPDVFYTWAGGVMEAQAEAGVLRDITEAVEGDWAADIAPGALDAYRVDGRLHGVPWEISQVGFWINEALFEEAGVDPAEVETWDDYLAAIEALKEAGITPIATGGGDKWPLHFYYTHLAGRIGGEAALAAAKSGEGEGFAAQPFVEAGERFAELVALDPFQPGFLGASYSDAAAVFGDGEAAMQLQGSWNLHAQAANSASGEGVPREDLGWMAFPEVPGGAGAATDTLGGMNGWLVGAGAPDAAVDFLRFITSPENQRVAAEQALHVPSTPGVTDAIKDPYSRRIAENLAASAYHQIFWDQDLGPAVGRVVNDVSADLAAGLVTPQEAAERIQDAWSFENF